MPRSPWRLRALPCARASTSTCLSLQKTCFSFFCCCCFFPLFFLPLQKYMPFFHYAGTQKCECVCTHFGWDFKGHQHEHQMLFRGKRVCLCFLGTLLWLALKGTHHDNHAFLGWGVPQKLTPNILYFKVSDMSLEHQQERAPSAKLHSSTETESEHMGVDQKLLCMG